MKRVLIKTAAGPVVARKDGVGTREREAWLPGRTTQNEGGVKEKK